MEPTPRLSYLHWPAQQFPFSLYNLLVAALVGPPFFFMSLVIYSFIPHYAPMRVPGLEMESFYALTDRRYCISPFAWMALISDKETGGKLQ
jgi:hypothetical protein